MLLCFYILSFSSYFLQDTTTRSAFIVTLKTFKCLKYVSPKQVTNEEHVIQVYIILVASIFIVFQTVWLSRLNFETQLKIESLLPFSGSRKTLKITLKIFFKKWLRRVCYSCYVVLVFTFIYEVFLSNRLLDPHPTEGPIKSLFVCPSVSLACFSEMAQQFFLIFGMMLVNWNI